MMKRPWKPLCLALCLTGAGGLVPGFAGTTWDGGGGDDNWGTGDNWNPAGTPPVGSTVDLTFAGSTRLTPNNNYTAWDDFRSILFASGAGAFTLTGNAVDLFGKIENNSTSTQTVQFADIAFNSTAAELNPVAGDLIINSANIFTNGNTINVWGDAGKTLTIQSVISQGGGLTVKQNSTVVLAGNNTFTGNVAIDAGTVRATHGNALGTNTSYVGNGGAAYANTNAALMLGASGLTVANQIVTNKADTGAGVGTGTRRIGGTFTSGTSTYSGNISLNGRATLTAGSGGTVVFSGIIQNGGDSGNVSRAVAVDAAGGTVTLTGNNTYTGGTTIATGSTVLVGNGGGTGRLGSGALANNGTLSQSLVGSNTTINLGGSGNVTGLSGSGASSFSAENINFANVTGGAWSSNTTGNQSYISTGTGLFKGMQFTNGAATYNFVATGGASITMKGDLGGSSATTGGGAIVNLDTSNGNGTIELDISVGRSNQWYNIGAFNANAGTGAINWTGSNGAVRGGNSSQGTPITLTGAINMTSGFQAQSALTLTMNATGTSTVSGLLAGTVNFVKGGASDLTLSNNNTYTGTTAVNNGRLILGGTTATSSTSIATGATLEIANASGTRSFATNTGFSGTGNLVKTGAGNVNWTGVATFALGSGALIDVQAGTFTGGNGANEIWTNNKADLNVAAGATFDGVEATATSAGGIFVDALSGTGTIKVGFASGYANKITFGADNGSGSFGGTLADTTAGWGNFVKSGTGTQTLTGASTSTGSMTVGNGTLVYQGAGSYASSSHVISSGATLEFNASAGAMDRGTTTFSGAGTFRKSSTGTLSWTTSAATFAMGSGGLIDVQAGILLAGSDANEVWTNNKADLNVAAGATFDAAEATSLANGGIFVDALSGAGTIKVGYYDAPPAPAYANKITFGVDNGSGTFSGVLANSEAADPNARGSFTKTGTGTQTLTGSSTATGTMTVNNGTLVLGHATNTLADTMAVTVDGAAAVLSLGTNNDSVGAVRIKNGGQITGTGGTLSGTLYEVESGAATANFGGSASLTKTTAGTVTLSGTNTYTGTTTVAAGVLALAGTGSIASSAIVLVQEGATLDVAEVSGGTYTIGDSIAQTLAGKGVIDATTGDSIVKTLALGALAILAPGESPGTLTIQGNLSLANTTVNHWELSAVDQTVGGNINDLVVVNGDLVLDGLLNITGTGDFTTAEINDSWRLFNYTGSLTNNGLVFNTMPTLAAGRYWHVDTSTANQIDLAVIPEPTTGLLLLLGFAPLCRRRR